MTPIANDHVDGAFVSEIFFVRTSEVQAPAKVFCRWKISDLPVDGDISRYFHTLDLLLSILPTSSINDVNTLEWLKIPSATGTALEILVRHTEELARKSEVAVKVILAPRDGYICRSDILDVRMRHCQFIDGVVSFSTWDRHLPAFPVHIKSSLLPLLLSSPGAVIVKQNLESSNYETMKLLQKDLEMRLSFDWILQIKPASHRMAVVGSRYVFDLMEDMSSVRGYFQTFRAFGISIIVLDEPGHWLEDKKYRHLYDEFLAVDMSHTAEAPQRIAKALQGRKVDGITTFMDDHVIVTAEAAEILGLPTEPAQAVLQAHHKHEMRKLVNKTNIQTINLDNAAQLDDPSCIEKLQTLQYPLIVKPSRGQSSRGVRKVTDEAGLRQAVEMLQADETLMEQGILVETYVEGPELDANFALWDGQVLFLEVTDNFPCPADAFGATVAHSFVETIMVSNSGLPLEEIEILRNSLQQSLLKLGFRSGVFHVEARVQNSAMWYQDIRGDGMDLVVRNTHGDSTATSSHHTDAFMIEVNSRPPGLGGTWSTLYTYGVDMGALHLLRALDDRERFEALSKPFNFSDPNVGGGGGAQYWNAHCILPIEREKVLVPEDYLEKLYQSLPDVIQHVSRTQLYTRPGTFLSQTGGIGIIGYFLLNSRTSRRHLLEMYHSVVEASKKALDSAS